jgi:sarcosine oxidase subunit beta
MIPPLGKVPVIRCFSEITEWTRDKIPIIGFVRERKGFLIDAGYSGHGFAWGPICGKLVAELILNGKPSLPLESFAYDRFKKQEGGEPNSC